MRFEGQLKIWNDERGFGFIESATGGQQVFVHVKAFPAGFGRPELNSKLTFEVEQTAEGKKRAKNVLIVRPARASSRAVGKSPTRWGTSSIFALAAFALLYLVVTLVWGTSIILALGYLALSLICGLFYVHDKTAAQAGEWRTSEGTLLLLGLLCGWPGAIVAQQMLRHKTSKVLFRIAFWVTVVANVGVFIAVTTPLLRAVQA
ncbi:DUF1294 domain-containing protein [Polaromonas sp. C04]|uniref:DUF1294 domain-containing protein n=1 Tax=Polaromonas sp. C04 TaxID=1945857 RepID=UPI00098780B7|nr:DUF1294 domain-containing protein [Polaromonas sp. C04]OOG58031.1 DNA-binding protein [Polaromonas sp. C04]